MYVGFDSALVLMLLASGRPSRDGSTIGMDDAARPFSPFPPTTDASLSIPPPYPNKQLVKDGFVIKKPQVVHSRARFTARLEAKRKGRHTGACLLPTVVWIVVVVVCVVVLCCSILYVCIRSGTDMPASVRVSAQVYRTYKGSGRGSTGRSVDFTRAMPAAAAPLPPLRQ